MGSQSLLLGLATAATQDEILAALQGLGLAPSGLSYDAEDLESDAVTTAFTPIAGRPFYLTLAGTGSATVSVVYSRDAGATFVAEVSMVDGSAPIVLNKGLYAGAPGVLTLQLAEVGVAVAVLAESVTGVVTAQFSQ